MPTTPLFRHPSTQLAALTTGIAFAAVLAGCASPAPQAVGVAELASTRGNTTTGTVRFEQRGDKVRVVAEVRGLKPNAEHGFHVHEKGDCSSGDGMSTGGHFNPGGGAHGRHGHGAHHAGDLPSLKADASGMARLDFETSSITVGNGATNVLLSG